MPIAWKEVVSKPEYQALQPQQKTEAMAQYFNDVVAPNVPQQDIQTAQSQFMGYAESLNQPEQLGFIDSFKQEVGAIKDEYIHAIEHPIDTAKSIGNAFSSVTDNPAAASDALVQMYDEAVANPSGTAGMLLAQIVNPASWISLGAGGVAAKIAAKTASRTAATVAGAATGAATAGSLNVADAGARASAEGRQLQAGESGAAAMLGAGLGGVFSIPVARMASKGAVAPKPEPTVNKYESPILALEAPVHTVTPDGVVIPNDSPKPSNDVGMAEVKNAKHGRVETPEPVAYAKTKNGRVRTFKSKETAAKVAQGKKVVPHPDKKGMYAITESSQGRVPVDLPEGNLGAVETPNVGIVDGKAMSQVEADKAAIAKFEAAQAEKPTQETPLMTASDNIPSETPVLEKKQPVKSFANSDQLLTRIKQMGGINLAHRKDILGEGNAIKAGAGNLFRKSGKGLDTIAIELADEFGIADADVNTLMGMIRKSLDGEQSLSNEGIHAAEDQRQKDLEELDKINNSIAIEDLGGVAYIESSAVGADNILENMRDGHYVFLDNELVSSRPINYTEWLAEEKAYESIGNEAQKRQGTDGRNGEKDSGQARQDNIPQGRNNLQGQQTLLTGDKPQLSNDPIKLKESQNKPIDKTDESSLFGAAERADAKDKQGELPTTDKSSAAKPKDNSATIAKLDAQLAGKGIDVKARKYKDVTDTKINDFGEKLGRAAKDKAKLMRDAVADIDVAKVPISKSFPKPDYSLIKDNKAAALVEALRDAVPTKPRVEYKVRNWAKKVISLRSIADKIMTDGVDAALKEFGDTFPRMLMLDKRADILGHLDRSLWDKVGDIRYYANKDGLKVLVGGKRYSYKDNVGEVLDQIRSDLAKQDTSKQPLMKFEIRGNAATKKYYINKVGDGEYNKLKEFASVKDAREFMDNNHSQLVDEWSAVKAKNNVSKKDVRNASNESRKGKEHRASDADEKSFTEAFGFRGVEFGNWVKQGKNSKQRQLLLNEAYDALMDMAEMLGIPSKAISLNGTLGLALGSRGHGTASAHFEPNNIVINLTKTSGAGSLGHEWFHALDNYFQRIRGIKNNAREGTYVTYSPKEKARSRSSLLEDIKYYEAHIDPDHSKQGDSFYHNKIDDAKFRLKELGEGGVIRPEMEDAFQNLVDVLNKSPMHKRSVKADKGKSDGYWSRIIERAARSFENYLIHTAEANGGRNDFLANIRAYSDWGGKADDRYPYLKPDEIAPVKEAFDNLFKVMKVKETDKGTALYSKGKASGLTTTQAKQALTKTFGSAITRAIRNGKIIIVKTASELPLGYNKLHEILFSKNKRVDNSEKGRARGELRSGEEAPYPHELTTDKSIKLYIADMQKRLDNGEEIRFVPQAVYDYIDAGGDIPGVRYSNNGSIMGAYDDVTKTTYIVADNNSESTVASTFIHEASHAFFDSKKGRSVKDNAVNHIIKAEKLSRSGKGKVAAWILQAKKAVPKNTPIEHFYEEILAYAAQQHQAKESMPLSIRNIAVKFLNEMKAFIVRHTNKMYKITPELLTSIARQNLGKFSRQVVEKSTSKSEGIKLSKSFEEGKAIAKDVIEGKAKGMAEVSSAIGRAFYTRPVQQIRDIGTVAAKKIGDLIYKEERHEKRAAEGHDLIQRRSQKEGEYGQRLTSILDSISGRFGVRKADSEALVEGLNSPKGTIAKRLSSQFDDARKLLDDIRDYMKEAGVDVGYIKNYFPRVYDTKKLTFHKTGFIKLLKKHGIKDGESVYRRIVENDGFLVHSGDSNRVEVNKYGERRVMHEGKASKTSMEKERKLDIPYDELKQFLVNDYGAIMARYVHHATKKAEFARTFGDNEQGLNKLAKQVVEDYANGKAKGNMDVRTTLDVIYGLADDLQGRGMRFNTEGLNVISRGISNISIMIYLPLVAMASFPEFAVPALKGGVKHYPKALAKGVVDGLTEATAAADKLITGKRHINKTEWRKNAELMGTVSQHAINEVWHRRFGDVTSKMTSKFMRATMLEQMTNIQKIIASEMAKSIIKDISRKDTPQARVEMKDFGLEPNKQHTERDIDFAAQRWAQQSITDPNEATTPRLLTHPGVNLIFQFKRFITVFSNTLLKSVLQNIVRYPSMASKAQVIVPAIGMIAIAYYTQYLRDYIKYGDKEPPFRKRTDTAKRWMDAVDRAGLTGDLSTLYMLANPYRYGFTDNSKSRIFNLMGAPLNAVAKTADILTGAGSSKPRKRAKAITGLIPVVNAIAPLRKATEKKIRNVIR